MDTCVMAKVVVQIIFRNAFVVVGGCYFFVLYKLVQVKNASNVAFS